MHPSREWARGKSLIALRAARQTPAPAQHSLFAAPRGATAASAKMFGSACNRYRHHALEAPPGAPLSDSSRRSATSGASGPLRAPALPQTCPVSCRQPLTKSRIAAQSEADRKAVAQSYGATAIPSPCSPGRQ